MFNLCLVTCAYEISAYTFETNKGENAHRYAVREVRGKKEIERERIEGRERKRVTEKNKNFEVILRCSPQERAEKPVLNASFGYCVPKNRFQMQVLDIVCRKTSFKCKF